MLQGALLGLDRRFVGSLPGALFDGLLLSRELQHLLDRLVQLRGQLLLPRIDLLLARVRELVGGPLHRVRGSVGGLLAGLLPLLLTLWLALLLPFLAGLPLFPC